MKKILTLALLLVGMLSMTGCMSQRATITVDIPDELTDEEIEITFWHTMGTSNQASLDVMIAEFNKIYPNITVTHAAQGGYDDLKDKVTKAIPAGTQPNLTYCYPDHVAVYLTGDAVMPLDDLISHETWGFSDEDQADFIEGFWNEGTVYNEEGTMYSFPFSKSTEVMFYNKTVFDDLGLEVPTTWDEMWEVCAALKAAYPDSIPLGWDSDDNCFITLLEQNGIPFTSASGEYLFDNDQAKALMTELASYSAETSTGKGYFTSGDAYGDYTSGAFTSQTMFMTIGSSGGASYNEPATDETSQQALFEYGIAEIPQADADNPAVIQQGPSLAIMKDEDDQKVLASWLFLQFITNTSNSAAYSMSTGYLPVRYSSLELDSYKSYLSSGTIQAETLKVAELQTDAFFTSYAFDGSSAAREQAGYIITAIVLGTKTIDQAFAAAMEELEG